VDETLRRLNFKSSSDYSTLIIERFSRLDHRARIVLQIASLFIRSFSSSILAVILVASFNVFPDIADLFSNELSRFKDGATVDYYKSVIDFISQICNEKLFTKTFDYESEAYNGIFYGLINAQETYDPNLNNLLYQNNKKMFIFMSSLHRKV
jgi:hypothetical protein